MKFFISIFRFTGMMGILGYVIFYHLNFSYWDNFLLFIGIGSFVAILALKFYWFFQLNYVKTMKTGNVGNKESAS